MPASDLSVVVLVAILDHDVAAGVILIDAPTPGEVIEEDIVLDDDVGDAVDVDVLVAAGLVIENISFNEDIPGTVIDLEDVVVVAVVQDVISQRNPADAILPAGSPIKS
ncbi:MAG: hypothetical protein A2Z14_17995 [Chloroflexi bacterium RBG_16_48_8]|nr:MAG: hypothetical protein A2Z14_17995 [Chloroflexi bacterium RBG_16_48_8]